MTKHHPPDPFNPKKVQLSGMSVGKCWELLSIYSHSCIFSTNTSSQSTDSSCFCGEGALDGDTSVKDGSFGGSAPPAERPQDGGERTEGDERKMGENLLKMIA